MEKYRSLLGKRIHLMLDGKSISSYKITFMNPNPINIPMVGPAYKCSVEWDPRPNQFRINDSPPQMDFDEKTLEDLCSTGIAQSPVMDNMQFLVENKN